MDEFFHLRQRIFFIEYCRGGATFTALLHFGFERRRPVRVVQHIGPAVAYTAYSSLVEPNSQLYILKAICLAKSLVKPAHLQEMLPGTGYINGNKRNAKKV